MSEINLNEVKFDERGLVPAIVQNAKTREVLTLAYMNQESLARTIETGPVSYTHLTLPTIYSV